MSTCKLCLLDKTLLKKSHIIPDFMYQDLYDDNHKLLLFNPHERAKGEGYVKRPSTGVYEGGILCNDCDNKLLASLEDYGAKVIFGSDTLSEQDAPIIKTGNNGLGVDFTRVENIDYSKFKLFLLSILWRASISSNTHFSEVKLGTHEDILRKIILEGNAGDKSQYPIFIMTYSNDDSVSDEIIIKPQRRRIDGYLAYTFVIAGMVYNFLVGGKYHSLPQHMLENTISPENTVNIIHIPKGQGVGFLKGFMGF